MWWCSSRYLLLVLDWLDSYSCTISLFSGFQEWKIAPNFKTQVRLERFNQLMLMYCTLHYDEKKKGKAVASKEKEDATSGNVTTLCITLLYGMKRKWSAVVSVYHSSNFFRLCSICCRCEWIWKTSYHHQASSSWLLTLHPFVFLWIF